MKFSFRVFLLGMLLGFTPLSAQTSKFAETFSTTTLDPAKWPVNNGPAVVNTFGASEPSAPYSLNLNNTDEVQSQTLDLSGQSNLLLRYYYEAGGDGELPDANNDLFFDYFNNAGIWVNLRQHLGGARMTSYVSETIVLPASAYHQSFAFRFRATGDPSLDDWFVDDVDISLSPDITVASSPDPFTFTLNLVGSANGTIAIDNVGQGDLNFNIAVVGSANASEEIADIIRLRHLQNLLPPVMLMPPRESAESGEINGGTAAPFSFNAVSQQQASANTDWQTLAPMTQARGQHGVVAHPNGKIYVFGGFTGSTGSEFSSLEIYDPGTNTWSSGAAMPRPDRGMATAIDDNGNIYAFAGLNTNTISSRYNPTTNLWTTISSPPFISAWEAGAAKGADGRIYLIGGQGASNAVQIYNPATDSWTAGNPMPTPRVQLGVVAGPAGFIYAMGGRTTSTGPPLNIVEVYDPATDTWSSAAPMPTARSQFAVSLSADGKIYAIGGKINYVNNAGPFLDVVEIYDSVTNTWTTGSPLPSVRGEMDAALSGNNIYAIGGTSGTYLTLNQALATSGASNWLKLTPTSGVVAPNATATINATVTTTGLFPGVTYRNNIRIASNDLDESLVQIPATLNVNPLPYFVVVDPAFAQGEGFAKDVVMHPLRIYNYGQNSDSYSLRLAGNRWQTQVFDSTGTTPITATPALVSGGSFKILVKVTVDSLAARGTLDTVRVTAISLGNPSTTSAAKLTTTSRGQRGTIPFVETFPNTTLDPVKWPVINGPAEVTTFGANEPSAPYSLNLNGTDEVQSQTLDLTGQNNLLLRYYYEAGGDGQLPDAGDDLLVDYFDNTGNWVNLRRHPGGGARMSSYVVESITLPADAYHQNFAFRFRTTGDAGSDDWFVDDISTSLPPDIAVTHVPDPFSFILDLEDSTTATITIANQGLGNLDFQISDVDNASASAGSFQRTKREILNKLVADLRSRADYTRSVGLNGQVTGNAPQEFAAQELTRTSLAPEDVAAIKFFGENVLASNIGIIAAETASFTNDVQAKLLATGRFASIMVINAEAVTPTLTDLSVFDAVMVWSNYPYLNSQLLGNNLADYVDQGGGVVLAMFEVAGISSYTLTGRWDSAQYYVMSRSGTYSSGTASLGTVLQPGHPLMNGVSTFSGGSLSYRPSTSALTSGATLIANWSDGVPLVAVKTINGNRRADLGFFPPSNAVDSGFWDASTDGAKLMANALEWVAGLATPGWLSFDRTSGTVAPNNSVTIAVKIRTTNLLPNRIYTKNVLIASNDPDEATVQIVATLRTNPLPYFAHIDPSSSQAEGFAKDVAIHPLRIFNYGQNTDSYSLRLAGNRWQTQIFDSTGTTPITATPALASAGSFKILVKVTVDSLAARGALDTVRVTANSLGNPSTTSAAKLTTASRGQRGAIPFVETFPSTTLDPVKWPVNNGPAVVNTFGANEPSTPYSLNLNGTDEVQSQTLDLSGQNNLLLRYYYEAGGDGELPDAGDDLLIDYFDNTGNWVNLRQHPGGGGAGMTSYISETIVLPAGAYHRDFAFRFRATGDPSLDDWFVDDVDLSLPPSIAVTPSPNPFSFTLGLEDSTSATMTITNRGPGNLDFLINDVNNASASAASFQSVKREALNKLVADLRSRANYSQPESLDGEVTGNAPREFAVQEAQATSLAPEDVAEIKFAPENAAASNIGIIAAENTVALTNDVQAKLLASGRFSSVMVINAAAVTPTLADLSVFDAIMVWKNSRYLDPQTLGNNLADYVDQDGGVVLAVFETGGVLTNMLSGRWESGQYYVISRSPIRTGAASLGTISQPGHPIMNNVSTFSGGSSSYRPSTSALTSGATLIASWSDGIPLVAVKTINGRRRADLGFFPPSSDALSDFWNSTTDGAKLMANALEWVAGVASPDWLTFAQASGTVAPNNSVTITAGISARNLRPDTTYKRNILISSNDPNNLLLTIPATLNTLPECSKPTHFTFTANTGNSYALIVDNATLDNLRLELCNEIGVFTPAGLCVGAVAWNDTLPLAFSAWEDNPETPAIDGYRAGEKMSFRIWDSGLGLEFQATPTYTAGNGNFGFGAFARLQLSATSKEARVINLRQGWNWISFNVDPDPPRVDSVFANVAGLEIVQNCAGQVYIPGVINQIGNLNPLDSYIVYMNRSNTVTVRGRKILSNTPILLASGWNCFSYLPDTPLSPQAALQSIIAKLNIVKDDSGRFMIPGLVDNIVLMRPGRGYKANLSAGDTLIYPGGAALLAKMVASELAGSSTPTQHFKPASITGESYSLVVTAVKIDGRQAEPGDEIAVFATDGRCVGAGVWNEEGVLALAAWKDDERTPEVDGYQSGETMAFRLWNHTANAEVDLTPTFEKGGAIFGNGPYAQVKLAAQTLPKQFALHTAYPNPFNPATTIAYDLPRDTPISIKIYDLMGRVVRILVDEQKPAGYHKVIWDGRNTEGRLVTSGVYLYRMQASGFAQTQRVLFLK